MLLASGWYGILAALLLVAVFAVLKVYGPRLPKPTDPGPPPKMPDVPDVPDSKWGDNVGQGLDPDDHPPG